MEEKKRQTVGKLSTDLLASSHEYNHSASEQAAEQLKDFEKNMNICIDRSKKEFDGDFYIVVTTKKERLMQNVIRNYFLGRKSCPTPEYDQAVYRYNRRVGDVPFIEFLWVVPAKDICSYMITDALKLPPEQRDLLGYVMDFTDGSLLRLAKKLNGEADDSPLLVKG